MKFGDVDGDGKPDFLVLTPSYSAYMYDHAGQELWHWEAPPENARLRGEFEVEGADRIAGHALCQLPNTYSALALRRYPGKHDFHRTTNWLLTIIAVFLAMIALRPLMMSRTVHAQSSPAMQIPIAGLPLINSQSSLNGTSTRSVASLVNGLLLFDQATGNVWGYPMYTTTNIVAGGQQTITSQPTFGAPTLYGTFNAPGQPMSPPAPQ